VAFSTLGWALDPASDNDTIVTPTGYEFPVPSSAEAAHLLLRVGSLLGLVASARWRTATRPITAAAVVVAFAALQLLAFRLSLISYVAGR